VIVTDPELADWVRKNHAGYRWSAQRSLFNRPIEVDGSVEGRAVRMR
jgi:hypothetical protein